MVFYKRNKFYAVAFILASLFANASEKVEVTADNFFADEVKQISILTGNVTIKKGDYDTLKSDKLTITFDKNRQPTKYTATGNANFKILLNGKHYDGKGGVLTYTPTNETYTLENSAYLHESESKKEVFGDKIVVNREKGTYEVKSGSGAEKKPIRLIFQVEDNK
ncbi:MAG: lipopolysaccharide transport periplasmic protein LptA [Campylobacter sp.]|nr:lipopolysaccharide transport periplasmic protein LptA [Campylobacter sp.]MBQ7675291.1 lipopolysaccharide transport periplasmic protein LptA [Campylobacter sp.]MBQ9875950.1 lipopolysaccharide transport periplasmic protein LptA [Campylobacter sp.]MBR0071942.1 lipopolysaccharide transport periplasmic protein LptA [Campylobacter sp.]MBR7046874.1 lipopolysaccharide transport periplasmic protein LptA [Campylobacter sp.]